MISVILSTCKRSPEIVKRAVDSIVRQTYTDWELYVVDDSPETYDLRDSVQALFDSYAEDGRIHYVQHEKNRGACIARNQSLDYITLLKRVYLIVIIVLDLERIILIN